MPAELFRSASSYTPVRRRASILPVSIAAHVALIAAIFTAPLFGDIDFPPPNRPLNFAYTNVVLPPPPPVRLKRPPSQQTPTTSADKAPLVAPDVIKPGVLLEPTPDFGPAIDGDPDGALFGPDGIGPPVAALPPPPVVDRKPMKVGGLIQAPRRIVSVAPIYPPAAQQARIDGAVTIEALIGEDGKVRNATVIRGKPMLSEAALTAVRQWVFTPTRLNGEPVAVIMTVTVVFSLN
jgi:protein TonB